MTSTPFLSPQDIQLARADNGALELHRTGEVIALAPPKRMRPLTDPDHFIVLFDVDNNPIGVVRDVMSLEPQSRSHLVAALNQAYVIKRIKRIFKVDREALTGQTRWRVEIEPDEADAAESAGEPDAGTAGNSPKTGEKRDGEKRDGNLRDTVNRLRGRGDEEETYGFRTEEREILINGQEDVQTARYPHIYIVDSERNRYEILDCEALDLASRHAAERFF